MVLLGLLLLAATGAFTGLLIAYNSDGGPDYTVTVFNNDIATMNSLSIFLAGIALALLFCIGAALAMRGGARRRHRSIARRETRAPANPDTVERDALLERPARSPTPADQAQTRPPGRRSWHLFGH